MGLLRAGAETMPADVAPTRPTVVPPSKWILGRRGRRDLEKTKPTSKAGVLGVGFNVLGREERYAEEENEVRAAIDGVGVAMAEG